MQLVSPAIRVLYLFSMVVWSLLNVAEFGFKVTRKNHIFGVSALKPLFEQLIIHQMALVQVKNVVEVSIALASPLLWFPCDLVAPLLPIIAI